jgi:hypothetical protein
MLRSIRQAEVDRSEVASDDHTEAGKVHDATQRGPRVGQARRLSEAEYESIVVRELRYRIDVAGRTREVTLVTTPIDADAYPG